LTPPVPSLRTTMNMDIRRRLQRISLLLTDIDGVLTDGSIHSAEDGTEVRVWNVRDGFGYRLLRESGLAVRTGWITGRGSPLLRRRARELGVGILRQRVDVKRDVWDGVLRAAGVTAVQTAYVGDDWLDIPLLRRAGLAVCPADAPVEVRRHAHLVTRAPGGGGVMREVIELLLRARGVWERVYRAHAR